MYKVLEKYVASTIPLLNLYKPIVDSKNNKFKKRLTNKT